jgi:pimeloyl-ACP methyl ester carboxylesterase
MRVGPALADRYRVYALDMRGHGESFKPPRGTYSLRRTADDAFAFIEEVHLERPVLMGHSWGGATALVLASGAFSHEPVPDLACVILEDPAHHIGGDSESLAFYTKDIGRPPEELRAEITRDNPSWSEADVEGKIEALQQVTQEALESIFADAEREGELLPLLARIAVPTLLIRADAGLGTLLDDAAWEEARRYLPAARPWRLAARHITYIAASLTSSCRRSSIF